MTATASVAATAARARGLWRRSLQTRVAVTTFALSGTVLLLLGVILLHQVRDGLVNAKTRAALAELDSGLNIAENQLAAADRGDPASIESTVDAVVATLSNQGSPAGLYDVVLLPTSPGVEGRKTGEVQTSSIPTSLRRAVATSGREAYAYSRLTYTGQAAQPGVVVGGPVQVAGAAPYQLYYLFSLRPEASTLALVERTLLFAGAVLVLVLVGVAGLVTRQVVTPVRVAARSAARLASGRLEERIAVRGEDDLARLGRSFNDMAAALQGQIRKLEELSRVQRQFVADVSHELRTPLTTVRMAADVLFEERAAFSPETARSTELLQAQIDRFEALLTDLLEISRHDAGAAVLDAEPVDLRAVVARVVEGAEPIAERYGTSLCVDMPAGPVVADIDARRVARVLRNLVVNAIEHGEGRAVDVRLRGSDDAVAVAVRDYGVGLQAGEEHLVFHRFWRADPARARTSGGTGLGLSIALEDTRLHGGRLQATGLAGRGSLFVLTLPRHAGGGLGEPPIPLDLAALPPLPRNGVRPAASGTGRGAPVRGSSGG